MIRTDYAENVQQGTTIGEQRWTAIYTFKHTCVANIAVAAIAKYTNTDYCYISIFGTNDAERLRLLNFSGSPEKSQSNTTNCSVTANETIRVQVQTSNLQPYCYISVSVVEAY